MSSQEKKLAAALAAVRLYLQQDEEAAAAAQAAQADRDAAALRAMSSNARGLVPAKHEDYLDIIAILEENAARRRDRRS